MSAAPSFAPIVAHCACGEEWTDSGWSRLKYVGEQHIPADEFGPEERFELRNCGSCDSTRAREVSP